MLQRAIVGQQISVAAARSIWVRLQALVTPFAPHRVVALSDADLRSAGLSVRKAQYILDLSERMHDGRLDPARWPEQSDDEVISELIQVKGIGRWTAEMFLIFFMARPDVFPVDDLGLQRAIATHYNRGRSMTKGRIVRLGERWMPWRTVATWYLWRSLEAHAARNE